jgi:hypothetical protein
MMDLMDALERDRGALVTSAHEGRRTLQLLCELFRCTFPRAALRPVAIRRRGQRMVIRWRPDAPRAGRAATGAGREPRTPRASFGSGQVGRLGVVALLGRAPRNPKAAVIQRWAKLVEQLEFKHEQVVRVRSSVDRAQPLLMRLLIEKDQGHGGPQAAAG